MEKLTKQNIINRQTLISNWHLMRTIRLVAGIFIAYQAIQNQEVFSGLIAAFFLFQAITNTGCCGSNGCSVPTSTYKDKNQKVSFEEIK